MSIFDGVAQLELDPHMAIDYFNTPSPMGVRPQVSPAQLLEALKPDLQDMLNLDEDDEEGWKEATEGVVEHIEALDLYRQDFKARTQGCRL